MARHINDKLGMKRNGNRRGKRLMTADELCSELGRNPIAELIRLADKAESDKQWAVSSANWREIHQYIQSKRKPVDPVEQEQKLKQAATLDQLQAIKKAILAGTATVIDESTVIDQEPAKDLI